MLLNADLVAQAAALARDIGDWKYSVCVVAADGSRLEYTGYVPRSTAPPTIATATDTSQPLCTDSFQCGSKILTINAVKTVPTHCSTTESCVKRMDATKNSMAMVSACTVKYSGKNEASELLPNTKQIFMHHISK